ncbi:MAG: CHRD domain-containing protein [Deltaproteobacteria bacterium]|nr:MAG: CHRD domain-containing protein [Deltaproteobacteria bacterium]
MPILLMVLVLSAAPSAYAVDFTISLDVAQATTAQPGASGSGMGTATLDTATNLFSWDFEYSDLAGAEVAAHFHKGAPGVPGAIESPPDLLSGSPKIGSVTVDAGQAADILANLWYANIHTDHSFGGEIRGQVVQVGGGVPLLPLPALALLALLLLGAALWLIRRRTFADAKARV